jgi:general nucleoside transport system ATP-binding protein
MHLELRHIDKRFGKTVANRDISLLVESGTIHAVLGENGAGKSTLMKIISGFIAPDSGEVLMGGERLPPGSPHHSSEAGIGMLHQDPLVFLPMTMLDNALLGSGRNSRTAAEQLADIADRLGFHFRPDTIAGRLSVGARQQHEMIRLLWLGVRVLILDEPTTGITAAQRDQLFAALRTLAGEGLIVLFVSHKLEEVAELCDRVTVLRHGSVAGETELPAPPQRLVEMMFGRSVEPAARERITPGYVVLDIDRVEITEAGASAGPITIEVRQGEALGLAGLEGSGQRLLLRACAGRVQPTSGRVLFDGVDPVARSDEIHYVPAGRLEEGLIPGLNVTEHLELTAPDHSFTIDWGASEERAGSIIARYQIRGTPETLADVLSGGNQQRLMLAMAPEKARLLLLEQPTRGLDLESARWVWSELDRRRSAGATVVFTSSDLDELVAQSDRIAVFFAGKVVGVVDSTTPTISELGYLIGGLTPA